jgi:hypothetical protein
MNPPSHSVQGRWVHQNDPQLFETLRKHTLTHLQATLARVLGKADDWLFDLAQKEGASAGAPSLEAMRVLRLSRGPLEQAYTKHFDSGFDALLKQIMPESPDAESLSLVEADQLEAQLASEVVVEAIVRAHGPALDAVERRLACMVGVMKIDGRLNPLSAPSLANGLQLAQVDMPLPDNLRVVLFKIYEREMVQTLGILLTELNARMSAAGILPELGNPRPADSALPHVASGAGGSQAVAAAAAMRADALADDRATFDALCQLLHSWRPIVGASAFAGMGAAPGSGRPLAINEMVSVLSLLQPQVPAAVNDAMENAELSLAQLIKQEMLQNATRIGLPPDQVRISPEHEDAVDLVGMLFDVLFDERDFEAQARTLISRLVVPYVKAAVIDRRLFQFKTHPARRLLNSLSEAVEGNRGEGPQEKELLGKAEQTVDRLVAEFNEDIAIFETLEQELRAFLEQHHRRIDLAERRATEAQRGQERLEQARGQAAAELEARLSVRTMPPALQEFLSRAWSHHLSMIALREGPECQAWNAALGVADSLIELLPTVGAPSRQVGPAIQNLRDPIENVLASSGITGESADQVLRDLVRDIEQATPVSAEKIEEAKAAAPKPERRVEDNKPALQLVASKENLDYDEDDLPTIRALKIGTWVDMAGEDEKLHPAKLSWISPISSRLMFVNRRGVRILVASVEELAAMKKQSKLALRHQDQVFDQALHRVMGKLQSEIG